MYTLLDIFFLIFHSSLVVFTLVGWIWKETRRAHLLVLSCLQKDPNRRFHHIGDAKIEIENALTEPATAGPTAAVIPARRGLRQAMPWSLAFLLLGVVLSGVGVWLLNPPRLCCHRLLYMWPFRWLANNSQITEGHPFPTLGLWVTRT